MTTPSYGTNGAFTGVPSQNVNIVNAEVDKTYSEAFMQATAESDAFCPEVSARSKYIDLAATLQVGRVLPWTQSKVARQINAVFIPVPMKPLQASISIDKYDFMGDVIGIHGDAIRGLANQAKTFKDWNVANAMQSGFAADYASFWQGTVDDWGLTGNMSGDGLAFFSSAHTWPGTNVAAQSNLVTGSLSDPLTYGTAITQMNSFVGDESQPLRVRPVGLVYGPSDEYSVFNAIDAKLTAIDARPTITTTNAMPKVALDNQLNRYGLQLNKLSTLSNNPGVAYLIGQVNGVGFGKCHMLEQLHLVPSVAPTDKSVFYDHEFIYSVEGYGRVIPALWFCCIRISDPAIAKNV